jgi:RNA-directed DNA polymerase
MYTSEVEISSDQFLSLDSISDLARLLSISSGMLIYFSLYPVYSTFHIPKKSGGYRLIEAPEKQLKSRQRIIANHLQAVYLTIKPESAHGFISSWEEGFGTCNIISNASIHTGKKFVLNIDLKDFFHAISAGRVRNIFMAPPFSFNHQLSSLLAIITTYYNKLPMGAPSSPVLSNLACLEMDKQMEEQALQSCWNYSRYADDLTYSWDKPFRKENIHNIKDIIEGCGFSINRDKFRIQPNTTRQTVTGLTVNEKVNLNRKYYRRLRAILHDWSENGIEEATRKYFRLTYEPDYALTWKFQQSIAGKINYFRMVRGKSDPLANKLREKFYEINEVSYQYPTF